MLSVSRKFLGKYMVQLCLVANKLVPIRLTKQAWSVLAPIILSVFVCAWVRMALGIGAMWRGLQDTQEVKPFHVEVGDVEFDVHVSKFTQLRFS